MLNTELYHMFFNCFSANTANAQHSPSKAISTDMWYSGQMYCIQSSMPNNWVARFMAVKDLSAYNSVR